MIAVLNAESILKLTEKAPPSSAEEILDWLEGERFILREPAGGGY